MSARGFTLLETLVALAVLALALGALLAAGGSAARQLGALRERTLAGWLADNRLAALMLARPAPAPGERAGSAEYGGRRWHWRERVAPAGGSGAGAVLRLEVEIAAEAPDAVRVALAGWRRP